MVRSRDVVYPPEGSGTSAVETWFNRLNQRLQALAMTSGNAWEPGGRDTPRPDMYQLYRAADRTSPPAPVIAQAGGTRGLKPIVRPVSGVFAPSSADDDAGQRGPLPSEGRQRLAEHVEGLGRAGPQVERRDDFRSVEPHRRRVQPARPAAGLPASRGESAVASDDRPAVEKLGQRRGVLLRRLTPERAAQHQLLPVPRLEQERHRAHPHLVPGRLDSSGPVHFERLAAAGVGQVESQDEPALVTDELPRLVARNRLAKDRLVADAGRHFLEAAQVPAMEREQGLRQRGHLPICSTFFSSASILRCSFSISCAIEPLPNESSACLTLWSTFARSSSTAVWPAARTSLTGLVPFSSDPRRSEVNPRTFCSRFSRSASVRLFISSMRSLSLLPTLSWEKTATT